MLQVLQLPRVAVVPQCVLVNLKPAVGPAVTRGRGVGEDDQEVQYTRSHTAHTHRSDSVPRFALNIMPECVRLLNSAAEWPKQQQQQHGGEHAKRAPGVGVPYHSAKFWWSCAAGTCGRTRRARLASAPSWRRVCAPAESRQTVGSPGTAA